jgi:hypothetical protein
MLIDMKSGEFLLGSINGLPDAVEHVGNYLAQNGYETPTDNEGRVTQYLGFLANVVGDGVLTNDQENTEWQIDHIPTLSENPEIAATQKERLHDWVKTLKEYPDWFKLWAFNDVARHTAFLSKVYDEDNRIVPIGFLDRTEENKDIGFPQIREELIFLSHRAMETTLSGPKMDEYYDRLMGVARNTTSFINLYRSADAYKPEIQHQREAAIAKSQEYRKRLPELLKETEGTWRTFEVGAFYIFEGDKLLSRETGRTPRELRNLALSSPTAWEDLTHPSALGLEYEECTVHMLLTRDPQNGQNEVPRACIVNGILSRDNEPQREVHGIIKTTKEDGSTTNDLDPNITSVVETYLGAF